MKRFGILCTILCLLCGILAIPVFAAGEKAAQQTAASTSTMLEPARLSLLKLGEYLPRLGGLLLILVVGALIAVGVAALVGWLLKLIRLEKGAQKIKIPAVLKKGGIGLSLSELITEIIFFLIIIAALITALEFYGVGTAVLTSSILVYIPQVISAVFILILGILAAILISGIIKLVGGNVKIAQSDTLANVARYAIIVVSAVIALKELGAGAILTDRSKDIVLGGIVLALALGAKEKAGDLLGKIFKK